MFERLKIGDTFESSEQYPGKTFVCFEIVERARMSMTSGGKLWDYIFLYDEDNPEDVYIFQQGLIRNEGYIGEIEDDRMQLLACKMLLAKLAEKQSTRQRFKKMRIGRLFNRD